MYALRHSFVSNLLQSGVDIYTISQMSGHDPETLLRHYASTNDPVKQAAVLKLPSLEVTPPDEK